MEKFKVREGSLAEIIGKTILRTIPLAIMAFGVAFAIFAYDSNGNYSGHTFWLIVVPLGFISIAIGVFNRLKRQKKIFESFELVINDELIIRKQDNTPDLVLNRSDIVSINRTLNGGYTLKGKGEGLANSIEVPAQMENNERLGSLLESLSFFEEPKSEPFRGKYLIPVLIVAMVSFGLVLISTNKILVGIGGTVLLCILTYKFRFIRQSPAYDSSMKKKSWFILVPILWILVTVLTKLFR